MKNLEFESYVNGVRYFFKYKYQNYSFPLIVLEIYRNKLFGIKYNDFKLESPGHLRPKECENWDYDKFLKHAIETLQYNLSLDDTNKGVDNFIKVVNESK